MLKWIKIWQGWSSKRWVSDCTNEVDPPWRGTSKGIKFNKNCQRVYEVQACDGPRIEMGTHLKKLSLRTKKGIYHEVALYHVKRREQTFLEESMHYIHKYK
jgi:hypothetical protein